MLTARWWAAPAWRSGASSRSSRAAAQRRCERPFRRGGSPPARRSLTRRRQQCRERRVDVFGGVQSLRDPSLGVEHVNLRRALHVIRAGDGAVEAAAIGEDRPRHLLLFHDAIDALEADVNADADDGCAVRVLSLELSE